jgi:prevent-host-death family protein
MAKVVGVTEARASFKAILDAVKEGEACILARGSRPEAVLIPYEDFVRLEEAKRRDWDRRFNAAVKRSHALFKEWLRKRGIRLDRLKEADLERIVRDA